MVGLPDHVALTETEFDEALAAGPTLAPDGTPRAWSVQVASFAEIENAERLREQLLDDGFEAYVTETRDDGRMLYRVAVGPSLDPGAVRRLQADIAERYDLDGIVVRFVLTLWTSSMALDDLAVLDLVVLGTAAVSILIGAIRGFVREALSLAVWLAAFLERIWLPARRARSSPIGFPTRRFRCPSDLLPCSW